MPKGRWLSKQRHLAFTRDDAQAFTWILLARFPTMKFMISNTSSYRYDPFADGPPPERELQYVAGLGAVRGFIEAWLEPPGWEPDWGPSRNGRYWSIRNAPSENFIYQSSHLFSAENHGFPSWALMREEAMDFDYMERCRLAGIKPNLELEKPPPTKEGYETIDRGCIHAVYDRDDRVHKAFISQVWRLLSKFATNRLTHIDLRTGEPTGPPEPGGIFWAGPDALNWARTAPNRFVAKSCKPADWYDDWLARRGGKPP